MKIGIVGSGAVGRSIGAFAAGGAVSGLTLAGICDADSAKAARVAAELGVPSMSLAELLGACDLVVEATAAAAMPGIVREAVASGTRVLTLSVGGFALDADLVDFVRERGGEVYLPSGGIVGIDGLLALRELGLERVEITTIKAPRSLAGAPYFQRPENSGLLENLAGPRLVFSGSAREAIAAFPANVNLAVTVSLAGIGVDRTRISIHADPAATVTRQRLLAVGGGCRLETEVAGPPLPENPRTSLLAANSVKALLRSLASAVRVGT